MISKNNLAIVLDDVIEFIVWSTLNVHLLAQGIGVQGRDPRWILLREFYSMTMMAIPRDAMVLLQVKVVTPDKLNYIGVYAWPPDV